MITSVKDQGKVVEVKMLINMTVVPKKNATQFYPWNFHERGHPFGTKRTQLQGILTFKLKKTKKKRYGKTK